MYANAPSNLVGGGINLNPTLNGAASNKVGMSQSLMLNVTGGNLPLYFNANPSNCGQVSNSPPYAFTPSQPGVCTITITDSTTPVAQTDTYAITVTPQPL